jgi:hypothetical protein
LSVKMDLTEKKQIWLVGALEDNLPDCPILTNHQILKRYFHMRFVERKSGKCACTILTHNIHFDCDRIGLQTLAISSIREKIKRLVDEYQKLAKNKGAKWQEEKVDEFRRKLSDKFKCFVENGFSEQSVPACNSNCKGKTNKKKLQSILYHGKIKQNKDPLPTSL